MQLFAADYPFDLPQDHVDFLKKYASLLAYWDGLFPNRKRGIFRLVHKPRFAPGVADLVAAVISTFVRDEPPAMLSLASQLRSYATDLMVEQGFTPKTRTDVKRVSLSSSPGAIHRVLLAGCQNEVELLSRVQCCAELLASTEGPTEVVLSGRNPGGRGAYQILDEATIMQSWLEEMKSSNPGLRDRVTWTRLEQQSTRSEENVANFFRQVTADRASEMGAVFIVSSDYHLPRLVRTATQHIRSHSLKATCLVAAGAPYPTSGNSRAQLAFLKQALFEVCSHFQGFMPSPEAVRDRGRDLLREFLHSRNEIRPASLTCRRKIRFRAQDSVAQVSFRHRFTGSGSMDVTLHSPGTLEGPKGDVE